MGGIAGVIELALLIMQFIEKRYEREVRKVEKIAE